MLDDYRDQADPYLLPLARRLLSMHPDTVTWAAFMFAALAGLTFYAANFVSPAWYLLFPAAAFIFLNGLLDMLDGRVARLTNRASVRGDFLDHVLDRYADVFIIGGIMVSPFCDFRLGLLAILGVIFASYMGTQAQAVGLKRNYGGLLGRADRLALLIIVPLVQMALSFLGWPTLFTLAYGGFSHSFTLVEILMIWFAVAGHLTAVQRARETWAELGRREREEAAGRRSPLRK